MLTPEQQALRKGRLTASRVAALVSGDPAKIYQLWLEMTNQAPEEDLSKNWAVQLGAVTEALNLDWYEANSGHLLSRRGHVMIHPMHDWAACTLDGYDDELHCPVEAKHVAGFEPAEMIIDRYQPQMHWAMSCTGATECALTQIRGAAPPIVDYIPFDQAYADTLFERGEYFMMCVEMRKPPVKLAPVPPPIDATAVIDMTFNNKWAAYADEWLQAKPIADRCDELNKLIKAMIPPEGKRIFGHGIRVSRDRAGRLSLRRDADAKE